MRKETAPQLIIREYGDADRYPLLFIGGWGVSTSSYEERILHLSQQFKIYSISLPGFGENEPLELRKNHIIGLSEYIRVSVQDIVSRHDSILLMGHSTGAAVATFLATYFPEKVNRLVLVSPVGSPDPLTKSFIRMLKVINMKEVLRYNTAEYRKRALANIRLGFDAKYIDLSPRIYQVIDSGVPVDLFLSEKDQIAPPGKLAEIDKASIHWVEGGHSWFKHDRTIMLEHLSKIVQTEEPTIQVKRSAWLRFIDIMLAPISKIVSK